MMSYQEKRKKNSASVLFQSQKILEKAFWKQQVTTTFRIMSCLFVFYTLVAL